MSFTLRQPEYTGKNRCTLCTIFNVFITIILAIGISGLLAFFTDMTQLQSTTIGGSFILVSLALIYFRGYLIPGTPEITARYFPEWLLSVFKNTSWEPVSLESRSEINPEEVLLQSGIIAPCPDRDDLCLTPEFRQSWNARIGVIREEDLDPNTIAKNFGVKAGDCSIRNRSSIPVIRCGSTIVGKWPSEAALLADAAAANELSANFETWDSLGHGARRELLYALRLFIEDCPTNDSGINFSKKRVNTTCCGSTELLDVSCQDGGDVLLEAPW
jgi:hypothetical protein